MKLLLAGAALSALTLSVTAAPAVADGMPRARAGHPAPQMHRAPARRHHAPARPLAPAPVEDDHGYDDGRAYDEGHHNRHVETDIEVNESDTGWVGDDEDFDADFDVNTARSSYSRDRRETHSGDRYGSGYTHGYQGGGAVYRERREHHYADGSGRRGGYSYDSDRGYQSYGDGGHHRRGDDHDGRDHGGDRHHGGGYGGVAQPYEYGYGAWNGYYGGGWRLVGEQRGSGYGWGSCGQVVHTTPCGGGYAVQIPYGFGESGVGYGVAESSAFGGGFGGGVIVNNSASASASAFARSNAFAFGRGGGHRGGHRGGGHHGGGYGGGHR